MSHQNFRVSSDIYASKEKRFINYIIDIVVFYVAFFAFSFIFGFVYVLVTGDVETVTEIAYDLENLNPWLDRLITAIIYSIFYMICESLLRGRTVGKFITKTKVIMEDGERPKVSDIILRSLCRIIPFEGFSFLGEKGRGWHDSMSDTYVVDIAKFKAKKEGESGIDLIGRSIEE